LEVLPAFEYLRLHHRPIKFYPARAIVEVNEDYYSYQLSYKELNRKLKIDFEKTAPYQIIGWQEIDLNDKNKTTTASKFKTVKLSYWKLNHLGDERFRDSLGLN
jgi:hypothetical protein